MVFSVRCQLSLHTSYRHRNQRALRMRSCNNLPARVTVRRCCSVFCTLYPSSLAGKSGKHFSTWTLLFPQISEMPRKRKGFGRRLPQRHASAPADLCQTSNRPSKCKCWTNEQMQAALSACSNGMPVKKAAAEHGGPTTTLRDRITERVVHGTKPGPKPHLSSLTSSLS